MRKEKITTPKHNSEESKEKNNIESYTRYTECVVNNQDFGYRKDDFIILCELPQKGDKEFEFDKTSTYKRLSRIVL